MAFNIHIKPVVIIDADEAVKYYEQKQAGLGRTFL